jgi:hypothetical protein
MVLREVADILQIPMGTAASHLARGKAAVAAYVDLVPELEKSSSRQIDAPIDNVREILIAEVVDSNE